MDMVRERRIHARFHNNNFLDYLASKSALADFPSSIIFKISSYADGLLTFLPNN
jgi:hypothetical protein